jgi:nucleoside-diphosphate-sugar epimerase
MPASRLVFDSLTEVLAFAYLLIFKLTADSWPEVFDDSEARAEWNWKPDYDLDAMVDIMFKALRRNYQ